MQSEDKAAIHPELRVGKWPFRRLIQFDTEETPNYFSADAHIRRRPIGRVVATNYDGILALGDLYVADPAFVRPELVDYWAPGAFRHLGIGSALLARAIEYATRVEVRQIIGGVTGADLTVSPFLLEWYEKKGFSISEGNEFPERLFAANFTIQMSLAESKESNHASKSAIDTQ